MITKKLANIDIIDGRKMSILDKGQGIYSFNLDKEAFELDINDIEHIKRNGFNQPVDISNGKLTVSIVKNKIPENSIFSNSDVNRNNQFVVKDNIKDQEVKLELDDKNLQKLMDTLNKIKISDKAPFKPGEKVWLGTIGFENRDGDWRYFEEPKETMVESVYQVDDDTFVVTLSDDSMKIGDHTMSNINIVFDQFGQSDNQIYVCGYDKEQVVDMMLDRINERGGPDAFAKIEEFTSIFEPFENTESEVSGVGD